MAIGVDGLAVKVKSVASIGSTTFVQPVLPAITPASNEAAHLQGFRCTAPLKCRSVVFGFLTSKVIAIIPAAV